MLYGCCLPCSAGHMVHHKLWWATVKHYQGVRGRKLTAFLPVERHGKFREASTSCVPYIHRAKIPCFRILYKIARTLWGIDSIAANKAKFPSGENYLPTYSIVYNVLIEGRAPFAARTHTSPHLKHGISSSLASWWSHVIVRDLGARSIDTRVRQW